MMHKRTIFITYPLLLLVLLSALALVAAGPVAAGQTAVVQEQPVYWNWDLANPIGTAQLVRNSSGVSADFEVSGLTPGHAVTLWIMFFNDPELCNNDPCVGPFDLFTDGGENGDFHLASGHVVGSDGTASFGGHLSVGDTSGSGRAELNLGAVALKDPYKADVVLAIHSHGPALTGQTLQEQISSFTGGCDPDKFLGPNGIADGPEDVPVGEGECSTIQFAYFEGN